MLYYCSEDEITLHEQSIEELIEGTMHYIVLYDEYHSFIHTVTHTLQVRVLQLLSVVVAGHIDAA
jgi:hypothetical protein